MAVRLWRLPNKLWGIELKWAETQSSYLNKLSSQSYETLSTKLTQFIQNQNWKFQQIIWHEFSYHTLTGAFADKCPRFPLKFNAVIYLTNQLPF